MHTESMAGGLPQSIKEALGLLDHDELARSSLDSLIEGDNPNRPMTAATVGCCLLAYQGGLDRVYEELQELTEYELLLLTTFMSGMLARIRFASDVIDYGEPTWAELQSMTRDELRKRADEEREQ